MPLHGSTHLGPASSLPTLAFQLVEWSVDQLSGCDGDEVARNGDWLNTRSARASRVKVQGRSNRETDLVIHILGLLAWRRCFLRRRRDPQTAHEHRQDGADLGRVGRFDGRCVLAWQQGARVDLYGVSEEG